MDPTPPDPPLIRAGLIRQAAAGAVVTLVSGVVSLGVSCIRGDTHGAVISAPLVFPAAVCVG